LQISTRKSLVPVWHLKCRGNVGKPSVSFFIWFDFSSVRLGMGGKKLGQKNGGSAGYSADVTSQSICFFFLFWFPRSNLSSTAVHVGLRENTSRMGWLLDQ
jgi:hypothetical protein